MKKFWPVTIVIVCVFSVLWYQRTLAFSELLPFRLENAVYCGIQTTGIGTITTIDLDADETDQLLQAMQSLAYYREGSGTSLQGCYARLFLWESAKERYEIMLSKDTVLVNAIGSDGRSPVYRVTPDSSRVEALIVEFCSEHIT